MRALRIILAATFLCLMTLTSQAQNFDSVLARLRSASVSERVAALRQLAQMPADLRAVKPLLEALNDSAASVRLEALITWGVVGVAYDDAIAKAPITPPSASSEQVEAAVQAWLSQRYTLLKKIENRTWDKSMLVRQEAVRTLALWGFPMGALFPLDDFVCFSGIAWELWLAVEPRLKHLAEQRPGLLRTLAKDRSPQVSFRVCENLVEVKDREILPILHEFVRHPDPKRRIISAYCLAQATYESLDEDFTRLLADDNEQVRSGAISWMRRFRTMNETRPYLKRLTESNRELP